MIIIPLQNIPNQSLSIQLGDNNVILDLKSCDNTPQTIGSAIVSISININEVQILDNARCIPSWPIINYRYLENGDFYFITENDEYPDYNQFGITQYLIYASATELEAIRNGAIN